MRWSAQKAGESMLLPCRRRIMRTGNVSTRRFWPAWTVQSRIWLCWQVFPPMMIKKYEGRIINIHPSLIPSFCGKGFYGLKVHEAVLARGVKITGATVHFVDEGTDTGPIILQKAVEVLPDDTPRVLQQRVMEQAEWVILPQAIHIIANGLL